MLGVANSSANAADEVDKMSQKIGLTKQSYQEWNYAMGQSGVDIGVMKNGVKTLTNLMDSAKNGTAGAVETFSQLGLTIYDSNGALKSQDEMMREAIMTLANMEDSTERAKLSTELFGKAGTELEPLLNSGADGITALIDRSHELGLVMSDEAVTAGVVFGDTIADVKDSIGMLATNLGTAMMPALQSVLDIILANLPMIQEMFAQFAPIVVGLLTTLLPQLMELGAALLPAIMDLLNQIIPFISEILDAILPILIELLNTLLPPMIQIAQTVLPIIIKLLEPILPLLQPILSLLSPLIELLMTLLKPLLDLINTILPAVVEFASEIGGKVIGFVVESITKLVEKVSGFVKKMVEAGKNLFSGLWDGIKSVWESIKNWVSEKVEWLIDKLAFWRKGNDEISSGKPDGSHASGLPFVPYDNYKAVLHRGETIWSSDSTQGVVEGIVNGIAGIMGSGGQASAQPIVVNVQIDKKTIASALIDPMNSALKQRGVAFG